MIRSLYTAVSGMITQEANQDVITNNMANINTIGFKSDTLDIKDFNDVLMQNCDKVVDGRNVPTVIGTLSQGSGIDGVSTNYATGTIYSTNRADDFAIDGNGFFAVSRDDGINQKTLYTRNGNFHINTAGYLVNDAGDKVLGRAVTTNGQTATYGNIGPIKGTFGNVEGDPYGIKVDGQSYKLDTVDFNSPSDLTKVGDNLFEGKNPIDNPNINVKQYSLEKSNVDVITSMTDMMSTIRNFESNQKVVQSIDETLDKAVNVVGAVK